jgi:hypothetical protein
MTMPKERRTIRLMQDFLSATRSERSLQFRFDTFNFANHPNFNPPGRIATFDATGAQTSPTFGAITSAQDQRMLQF